MPVARPQQQPSTPRPCCSHCCLPQGPCSTCAAAGQPAAAPAPCSLAVLRHKGPLQGVAAGSWLQLSDLGGAQPGGHVAVLLHLSRHHSHLLQCCQQECPTAPARQHPLQPLQELVLATELQGPGLSQALKRCPGAGCCRSAVSALWDMADRPLPWQAHHTGLGSCDTFACGHIGTEWGQPLRRITPGSAFLPHQSWHTAP